MNRKITALFCAAVMAALCLTACGERNPVSSSGGRTSEDVDIEYSGADWSGETLYISARLSGYGQWLDDYAEEFEIVSGATVDISWNPNLNSEVRTMFMSSSYVHDDLYFALSTDLWLDWAKDGKIVPINEFNDRLRDTIGDYGIYNGDRYVLETICAPLGLVYNQDYLDVIPSKGEYTQGEFPQTFQGLLDLCSAVNEMGTINGKAVKPMSWGGQVDDLKNMFRQFWSQGNGGEDWMNYLNQTGLSPTRELHVNQTVKNALTAMSLLLDSDGTYSRNSIAGCGEKTNIQQEQNFLNGDCVFCPSGGWFEHEMQDSITRDTFRYGFANMPLYDTSETVRTVMINAPGENFFIPSDSPNIEMAKDFLEFVFNEENCARITRDIGTVLSFDYDFGEEDIAQLGDFAAQVVSVTLNNKWVTKGSNNPLHLVGACQATILSAEGESLTDIFTQKMLTNQAGFTVNDVDKIMEDSYTGYVKKWPEFLRLI